VGLEIRIGLVLITAVTAYLLTRRCSPKLRGAFIQTGIIGSLLLPLLYLVVPSIGLSVGDMVSRAIDGGAVLVSGTRLAAGGQPVYGIESIASFMVLIVWMAGSTLLLIRMVVGMRYNSRIAQRGTQVSRRVMSVATELSERAGLRNVPKMVMSDDTTVPFVWGWRRPLVVLPVDAENWETGRIKITLMHEFNHIVRGDQKLLIIATISTALHWPDPLVWLVRRLFRNEAERACDDSVMRLGGRASDYAGHLLIMATALARNRMRTPLSMTLLNKSLLEGRLMRIMSMNGAVRTARPWALTAAVLLLAAITVGAASIQIQPMAVVEQNNEISSASAIEASSGDEEKLPGPDEFVPVEKMPEMVVMQPPVYPPEAKEKGIEGSVYVQSLVDKNGDVLEVKLGKTSGNKLLDKAALVSAKECKFKPGIQDGKPVAVWISYRVDFVLDGQADSTEN